MSRSRRIHDITRPLDEGTRVWPGDTPLTLEWTMLRSAGASVNVSAVRFSAHTGTHADAPYHVCDDGARIGALPIETFIGPAVVVDAVGRPALDASLVGAALERIPRPERLLFRTGAWSAGVDFPTRFAAFDPRAVSLLAAAGVRLVGTDAPSVDPYDATELRAHRALVGAGIGILENLLLDRVPIGEYELIALPLALRDADGSPVRAVLLER
jgi:arylformamidase